MNRTQRESNFVGHRLRTTLVVGAAMALAGCSNGSRKTDQGSGPIPPGELMEARVSVQAQDVQVGFARGRIRQTVSVDGYRISKHPVTLGEFGACVRSGVCSAPPEGACTKPRSLRTLDGPNWGTEAPEDVPVTCAGVGNAERYCGWLGGSLPTEAQWFLAARGSGVTRYAWGDERPTCDRHPLAIQAGEGWCAKSPVEYARVARYPRGASPLGVEDVLVAPSELVALDKQSVFSPCKQRDGQTGACLLYSLYPGSIDSASRLRRDPETGAIAASPRPYVFRCAWKG